MKTTEKNEYPLFHYPISSFLVGSVIYATNPALFWFLLLLACIYALVSYVAGRFK